jgi:formamidopyrimidine-DNA glycosylase
MPELPEVETIKIGLQKKIINLKIINIEILNPKTFQGNEKEIIGGEVVKIWRAAKMLGIDLSNGKSILFHLKMSGQIIYQDEKTRFAGGHPTLDMKDAMPNKSTRVIFALSDGSNIFFNDQRKFGWVKVVNTNKIFDDNFYKGLGPEPLDKSFTPQVLKDRLLKHKTWPIKVILMDQQTISGIGNIYAAEACFDAKLDPRVKVSELSGKDFENLHQGIIRSLKDGIKYGGSSRANFVNAEGEKGLFLDYAFVYGRKGDPCKNCATPIEKIELSGRGTYFCPNCQKKKVN